MKTFAWILLVCSAIAFPDSLRAAISLSAPKARQIVQRNDANQGKIPVSGTISGVTNLARVEARLVVMPGTTNNGVSTDWRALNITTPNASFSGTLTNIAAGGWYRLELRALDADTNELAMLTVDRIGVGDIFVTAGQSNAGCFGNPQQNPTDDRVSSFVLFYKSWQYGKDPQPDNSGGMGASGSPWPVLGSLLIASNHVPVGFVCLAVGGSSLASWLPGTASFQNVSNVLQNFGTNGVRAVLWHQGETDAASQTPATNYFQMMSNLITQSRVVAGWSVPWGIAEVGYGQGTTLAGMEGVMAGQRLCVYTVPDCFRGARTDDFHFEGKLSDSVHFNAVGLADHAQQWANALQGVDDLTVKNGNFEANGALLDGRTDITGQVIGWNRLNAAGNDMTAGSSGYMNPANSTYLNSADTINGGVLTNMNGKHVAFLSATVAGDSFLQTLRAHLQPSTIYTFRAAIGVRNGGIMGRYQLDFLTNGVPFGPGVTGNVSTLNALAGGNATNKFTVVSCVVTSTIPVASNQQLAVRITRNAAGYLDLDDAQVTSQLTAYGQWQMTNWNSLINPNSLPGANPDGDSLPNLIEFQLAGANPLAPTAMPQPVMVQLSGEDYWQMQLLKNPAATGSIEIQLSYDLNSWFTPVSSGNGDLIVVNDASQFKVQLRRSATSKAFFRIAAQL